MKLMRKLVLASLLILPLVSLSSLYLIKPSFRAATNLDEVGHYPSSYGALEEEMMIWVWNGLPY